MLFDIPAVSAFLRIQTPLGAPIFFVDDLQEWATEMITKHWVYEERPYLIPLWRPQLGELILINESGISAIVATVLMHSGHPNWKEYDHPDEFFVWGFDENSYTGYDIDFDEDDPPY